MSQGVLFAENYLTTPNIQINPDCILVNQVSAGDINKLQPMMSKANWRPAPGRKLGFTITHDSYLLGIAFLASPVINLGSRDSYLKMPTDKSQKGKELRHYADLSVCVPAQPFGWHWNGGKLVALIATTLGDFWQERYNDELKGICTTSLWGRGSQYNRIYKFLGYTKGYGHEHISDTEYRAMMQWMTDNNYEIPSSKFGAGSNPRMRRILAYRKASGDKAVNLVHGNQRGIYYHEAISPSSRQDVIANWYDRWGKPRHERTINLNPPYQNGIENGMKRTA